MKTILVADDQKNIREYCRLSLADEGYRVFLAADARPGGREVHPGIARLGDPGHLHAPDQRPGGAGEIKKLAPRTPVVLFTAHDDDCLHDRRAMLATACVEKAGDLTELKRTVAGILKDRRPETLPASRGGSGCRRSRRRLGACLIEAVGRDVQKLLSQLAPQHPLSQSEPQSERNRNARIKPQSRPTNRPAPAGHHH